MKKLIGVVSILVISVLGLSACSTNNEKSEKKEQSAVTKKEKDSILPIGNEYVYQDKSDYVKLTVLSNDEWSLQTEDMQVPEKFTVKDTKQEKDGFKLLEMTANKEINGHGRITITENKPWYYYLVDKGDKIGFNLKVTDNPTDIEGSAELKGYFLKQ
ncbi:hypothetical protein ACIJDX_002571 [Enterococcus faecalis]|uniref:hypothetical protein n=1 Tax=Enterococcus faecalis TaxID=1351 RepID=UPI0023A9438D|nr:hypothetical protein [Enterococcus faecalis]WEB08052.1 hypothetical protein PUW76_12850 [Enterococcus faecalis]